MFVRVWAARNKTIVSIYRVLTGYMDQKVAVTISVNVDLIELESRITLEKGLVSGGIDWLHWLVWEESSSLQARPHPLQIIIGFTKWREWVSWGLLSFILLFPICGCNVTRCFQLLLSGPPHHDELCLELWTQIKPSPVKLNFSEYFIVTTWRHLKTEVDGRRYENWWEQAHCSLKSTWWWGRQMAVGHLLDLNYTYA